MRVEIARERERESRIARERGLDIERNRVREEERKRQ